MKGFKRIISFFMAFAMVCTIFVLPVKADYSTSTTDTLWGSYIRAGVNSVHDVPIIGTLLGYVVGASSGRVCAASDDQLHHADSYESCAVDKDGTPYVSCICKYCGDRFKAVASDLSAAYDAYVATLPATSYTSSGGLSWKIVPYVGEVVGSPRASGERLTDYVRAFGQAKGGSSTAVYFILLEDFVAPIDGTYSLSAVTLDSHLARGLANSSSKHNFDKLLLAGETVACAGTVGSSSGSILGVDFTSTSERGYWYGYIVISCVPHAALSADTYNINTRPTSITGGNYGIVGDNGLITKVEDNSTIINETNNTYYNPATGQTVPITGWSYDYSDRSYKVTLESGDTVTVTYGDENITIQEGDTIYNVYYLIDGTGSGNSPVACEHDWQKGEATAPTCTIPGKASYVCTKCQQTKTETIPALGHDWQVKQSVTTEYDETGQLVQEGYTIFECSRCHEQYKSPDGTIPPGGGSGTDPGGEEGETIWDKLGNLIGAIGGGVIGLIDAALGKVLDALIVLAEKMMEKLKVVVETVLSIFDELPLIFGGFLDFLAALFPFLPPEIMTILTFGVIAVVFIAIIKAVRR